jgi:class I fructose-bisphosphate aldolase
MANQKILDLLGDKTAYYLDHKCETISKDSLYAPSKKNVDEVWAGSNRNIQTLRSIQTLLGNGRLKNSGYVSILPVDQGIEHSAGSFFCTKSYLF